ncbi:MAG: tetratricopeptide repeat protein [Bacillota bacterium]
MRAGYGRRAVFLIVCLIFIGSLCFGCGADTSAKVTKQLELAVKYLSENKFEEAILAYQEVLEIDRKNVMAYKGLSVAYQMQGKPDKAEQVLQDGLKKVADTTTLKLAMAGFFADLGQVERAEVLYKELIIQTENDITSYQAYASFLFKQNKVAEAIALLEKAVVANSDYRLKTLLAEAYLKDGNNEKALESIQNSLTTNPDQSVGYMLLDEIYNGKWEDLFAMGDGYVQQGQTIAGHIMRTIALHRMGRYDEVYAVYESLPNDVKASAKLRLIVARSYAKQGKADKGIGLLRAINPDDLRDAALIAEIAAYYFDAGKKDEACKFARAGMALDGTVVENYIILWKVAGKSTPEAMGWWIRFLLNTNLPMSEAITIMNKYGASLFKAGQDKSKRKIAEDISHWVFSNEKIQELKTRETQDHALGWVQSNECYLETSRNIAYLSYLFGDSNLKEGLEYDLRLETTKGIASFNPTIGQVWKPVIIRLHNPKIYKSEQINPSEAHNFLPGYEKYVRQVERPDPDHYHPVREVQNFEKLLTEAGYDMNTIVFVDIQ